MSRLPILTTERLRLRGQTMADLEATLAMDMDPAVHRYIWGAHPPAPAAHRATLRARIGGDWPPAGGLWVIEERDDPVFLGWCGVFPLEDSGLIEIGYRVVRAAWGRGIATEAARAVLDHGFRALGFDPIVAVSHPENTASHRVLEKIGLERQGLAHHYGRDLAFFRLDRDDYVTANPAPAGR